MYICVPNKLIGLVVYREQVIFLARLASAFFPNLYYACSKMGMLDKEKCNFSISHIDIGMRMYVEFTILTNPGYGKYLGTYFVLVAVKSGEKEQTARRAYY